MSHENPYQVLQVTHAVPEHAMRLKVRMIKSLRTSNNAHGNKQVIFFLVRIAWYYGDNYLLHEQQQQEE